MKKLLGIFAIGALLVSCSDESATSTDNGNGTTTSNNSTTTAKVITEGSPEEFAERLANFVIDSNYTEISKLIIEKQVMVDLIKNSSVMRQGKEAAIAAVDQQIGMMKLDMSNGLIEIRDSGRTAGVVWDNCNYKRCTYDIANPSGYDMMQLKVVVECNNIEHTFTVTDVPRTPDGWRLGGKMMFGDIQQK